MPDRGNVIYHYDGSFDGLMSCVFEAYQCHENPTDILPLEQAQPSLYPSKFIPTDPERAERVYRSIPTKIGPEALDLVNRGFLYGNGGKELAIYLFLRKGYRIGPKVVNMLGDEAVSTLHHMVISVGNECHLLLGFLRFTEHGGALAAVIHPKHLVLPLMREHFCGRFGEERFLIYDETHGMALVYQPYESKFVAIDALELPPEDAVEERYQRLWARYYQAAAVTQRYNPRCRMSHMPKRFWRDLTEMMPQNTMNAAQDMQPLPGVTRPEKRGFFLE